MGCTLAECKARVSSAEYTRWLAYWRACPPVEERLDLAAAVIAAAARSAFGGEFDAAPFHRMLDHAAHFQRAHETDDEREARIAAEVCAAFGVGPPAA